MKFFVTCTVVICLFGQCYSQQEPQFTMYWNNYSLYNPASTGLFNKHFAALTGRQQWYGLEGAPQTICAVYDYRINKIKSGIGINYYNGHHGIETNNKLNFNYAYHLRLTENSVLSLGAAVGVLQKTMDYGYLVFPTQTPDPLFPLAQVSDNLLNINAGAMFKTRSFIIGLGVTQLSAPYSEKLHFKAAQHAFANISYVLLVGNAFNITPGIYIKSDFSAVQVDANMLASYRKKYWMGVTFRRTDAIAFMAGVDIQQKFRIGYSYDYITSSLKHYSKGSHEVVIAIILNEKPTKD